MKKLLFVILLLIFSSVSCFGQSYSSVSKSSFDNYYFSPLRTARDHVLHSSLFNPPLFSAKSLEAQSGVVAVGFEYTSIDDDFSDGAFNYDVEGGLYRLNLFLDLVFFEKFETMLFYDVSGVDGDVFSFQNESSSFVKSSIKKSASGNIDLIGKYQFYTWDKLDLGFFVGVTIPVDNTKTLAVSRKLDFGAGLLATYQSDLYALHANLGFIYNGGSTSFTGDVDFNHSAYLGLSGVGLIVNNLYGIFQFTVNTPAMNENDSPSNLVVSINGGVRFVYNKYITEVYLSHGVADASHGIGGGISLNVAF